MSDKKLTAVPNGSAEASSSGPDRRREAGIFVEMLRRTHSRTDILFSKLLLVQWIGGIILAVSVSPRAWAGLQSTVHGHVWAATLLGGIIAAFPMFLAWTRPGWWGTRQSIAVAQMLASALLIHLTGGRIETHFHVFGSLAFLAFYRDWRVVATATVIVAADHFFRGVYWPQSVFGELEVSHWRWIEHAAWVVFIDIFLLIAIRDGLVDMKKSARREAELEAVNEVVEARVVERTRELQLEIHERKQAEARLEALHKQLVDASRRGGMAEIATNVLHNVGNVLNSVNVSATLVMDRIKKSKSGRLKDVVGLLESNREVLGEFFKNDPKGKHVLGYLTELADQLKSEQSQAVEELESLRHNIDHIKEIVAMQQSYAKASGVREVVQVEDLVEDALRMNTGALHRHGVEVVREFQPVSAITTDKHKVLQILVNLIRNAKHACDDTGRDEKRMVLRVEPMHDGVRIIVRDNGVGISKENMVRIFQHGFTTRANGHGFGLHGGALSAGELGGSLAAASDGPGRGAMFTLELPLNNKS